MVSGIFFELTVAALLTAAYCAVQPSSKDVDITSLNEHLRKMDAVLQEVQSHSKAQEEESRAILTRVFSHLTQATLELNISRSITRELQLNYTTAMGELAEVKQSQNNTLLDYTTAIQKLSKLEQSHVNTIQELAELKQSHNETLLELAELKQSHNRFIFELDVVKRKEISLQQDIQTITGTLSKSDTMVNELSQLNSTQFKVLVSLAEIAGQMNATGYIQLAGSDRSWSHPEIGFEAFLQRAQNVSAHGTIVFDTVTYNEGNGYNKSTGYFIAPVSGTYLFWTNIEYRNIHIKHSYYFDIKTRETILGRAYDWTSNEAYGTASATTLFFLKKGQEVLMSSRREARLNPFVSTVGAVLMKQSYYW